MKQKTEPVARMEVKDGITLEFLCVERKVVEVYQASAGCHVYGVQENACLKCRVRAYICVCVCVCEGA